MQAAGEEEGNMAIANYSFHQNFPTITVNGLNAYIDIITMSNQV